LLGLARNRQIRFTVRFRRTITITDERRVALRAHRLTMPGIGSGMSGVEKSKRRNGPRRLERGRRRTRQDQISRGAVTPVKLRTQGIRTNEENLFLLPDRFLIENTIQPLT
jgi:hypothetical protein